MFGVGPSPEQPMITPCNNHPRQDSNPQPNAQRLVSPNADNRCLCDRFVYANRADDALLARTSGCTALNLMACAAHTPSSATSWRSIFTACTFSTVRGDLVSSTMVPIPQLAATS